MKKNTLFSRIQFLLLLLTGCFLIWLSFRKLNINQLLLQLEQGKYWICLPVLAVSALGYYCRIYRWQLMLRQMGESCRKSSLYAALCMGYAVNFAVPRLGEISRCLIIKKTDEVKVDYALLSIIIERLIDTLTLALLFFVSLLFYHQALLEFIEDNIFKPVTSVIHPDIIIIITIVILFIITGFIFFSTRANGLKALLIRYKPAGLGLMNTARFSSFWFTTLCIWCCYFLMTYLWFFLFDESSGLSWRDAFVVMVIGSFGRSIPIQGGGMGAYHFLVSQLFVIFGLSLVTGNALALVIHGAQTIFTFTLGLGSYLWMLYDIKKRPLSEVIVTNLPDNN